MMVLTAKRLNSKAQSRGLPRTLGWQSFGVPYPEGVAQAIVCNAFSVRGLSGTPTQGGAAAPLTLGFGM
jgi:hypothetical protein